MKICYFGIYNPEFGRNKVYISGLKQNGHEVIECRDNSKGLIKYIRLWRRHRIILKLGGYDALIVGYPGHIVVPFAKMISKKTVVFDALCTLYEGEVISRGKYRNNPFMRSWINFIDYAAVKAADVTLVETNAQKEFFIRRFTINAHRIFRVFTGADEKVFCPNLSIKKNDKFTAVFRGKFLPEAGVKYIIQAAKILENKDVNFLIIGNGHVESEVAKLIRCLNPSNVEWISDNLSPDELVQKMRGCHISLGQFEKHERLERTIPHKAFESLSMGLPYITCRAKGIEELLTDGTDCLMVNCADSKDIAENIQQLKNNPDLALTIAQNGRQLFETKLSNQKLAKDIVHTILSQKVRLQK